jgi:hypothetical protein
VRVRAFKKKNCPYHLDLATAENISSHGGQVLIDSMARRFGLWDQLAGLDGIDPRKRQTAGFSPLSIMAQMVIGFTSGALSLADMERLGTDKVLLNLLGLSKGADQSTLGEWLRAQSAKSVEAVMGVNRQFVSQILRRPSPDGSCTRDARWCSSTTLKLKSPAKSLRGPESTTRESGP